MRFFLSSTTLFLAALSGTVAGIGLYDFPFKQDVQLAVELGLDLGLMFRDHAAFRALTAHFGGNPTEAEYTTVCIVATMHVLTDRDRFPLIIGIRLLEPTRIGTGSTTSITGLEDRFLSMMMERKTLGCSYTLCSKTRHPFSSRCSESSTGLALSGSIGTSASEQRRTAMATSPPPWRGSMAFSRPMERRVPPGSLHDFCGYLETDPQTDSKAGPDGLAPIYGNKFVAERFASWPIFTPLI
jgi:hypothetical protein